VTAAGDTPHAELYEDERLRRLTPLCLALPEAVREVSGRHAGFKVRGRTFAWFLDDHHGDDMTTLVFKAPPGESEMLLASDPERFVRPAYVAHRGWVALRLDRGPIDWEEAWELVAESYRTVAPKRLAAAVDDIGRMLPRVLDPGIQARLDAMAAVAGPPAHEVPVAEARAAHEAESRELSGPGEDVAEVRDLRVPGPAGDIPVRAYRPQTEEERPGVVAYFHGGGWCIGSIDGFDPLCRALANASGSIVVSVDYRLAPEYPFPAGLEDACTAVRWLAEHAAGLGADPARLAVAGDSAGANLATVAARRMRDEGGPPVRFQALVYPATDAALDTASYRESGEGYGLTTASMRRWWDLYLAGADGLQPDCSPLRTRDLAGMPPAFILTADRDPLRDEGELYARALEAAGVPVSLRRYDGAIHGFFRWLAATELSRRAVGEVGAALAAALAR
jgi:acetyl esterase